MQEDLIEILTIAFSIFLLILQRSMFEQASLFNQDLSMWDVSSGQDSFAGLGGFVSACHLILTSVRPSQNSHNCLSVDFHIHTSEPHVLWSILVQPRSFHVGCLWWTGLCKCL